MKKCNTGCNIQQDGIDTDVLHLIPEEVYDLMKKRARIRSSKPYNDKHKEWLKKQANKKGVSLRAYLIGLSNEVEPHLIAIEKMQQGGELDDDLLMISENINNRLNQIAAMYNQQVPDATSANTINKQYKKGGKMKPMYQRGSVLEQSREMLAKKIDSQRARLYDDNIAAKEGYQSTGFIKVDNPSEMLEADACYIVEKGKKPRKVDCSVNGAVKGNALETKDGVTYYMREQTKYSTNKTDGKSTITDWQSPEISNSSSRGGEGDPAPEEGKGKGKDSSNRRGYKWAVEGGCGYCTGKNKQNMIVKDITDFVSSNSNISAFVGRHLNALVSNYKKAGGKDTDTIAIPMGDNMKSFQQAAEMGCFCAVSGNIKVDTPPTETIEADRQVDVISEEEPKPIKDNINRAYHYYAKIEIPYPQEINNGKGFKTDVVYFSVVPQMSGNSVQSLTLSNLSVGANTLPKGQSLSGGIKEGNVIKGNANLGTVRLPMPSSDQIESVFGKLEKGIRKENTAGLDNYLREQITQNLNSNWLDKIKGFIEDKISKSKDANLESQEFETGADGNLQNRATQPKLQQGGQYPIGKEFLIRNKDMFKERNIKEYIKNYSSRISPTYFNQ